MKGGCNITKYSFVNIEDHLQIRWAGQPMAVRSMKYSTIHLDVLYPTLNVFYLSVGDIESMVMYSDGDMYNFQVAGIKREVFPGPVPQWEARAPDYRTIQAWD